jgi:hypothetical protein
LPPLNYQFVLQSTGACKVSFPSKAVEAYRAHHFFMNKSPLARHRLRGGKSRRMLINSLLGAHSKQTITPGQLQLVLIALAVPIVLLATVMQMVANGYGITLPPIVAISRPRARASRDITVPIGTSVVSAISR